MFVAIYKAICCVLRNFGISNGLDSLIAGCVGGWIAFGAQTGISGAVNQQINLYLLARGVEGLLKLLARRLSPPAALDVRKPLGFRVLTAATIATTMYMMDYEPDTLRDGLTQAMHSIYHASNSGSSAVPLSWWPLVAGAMALIASPLVSSKLRLEHLVTLF